MLARSDDPQLQLTVAKSATNLISGLAEEEAWRQQAVDTFGWLKDDLLARSDDPQLQLEVAQSAFNLINGLAKEEAWRQQALDSLVWLASFALDSNNDLCFTPLAMSTYSIMLTFTRISQWEMVEALFGHLTELLADRSISPDLLYEYADCLQLTLPNPQWAAVLRDPDMETEQRQALFVAFWSRFQQLDGWVGQFNEEERWRVLAGKVGSNNDLMGLIQQYGQIVQQQGEAGEES